MANCILAFPNYVDATYYSVAFSGGSWEPTLPLTNLRDRLLVNVTRSTDATTNNTKFDIDLGISRDIRVIAIPTHNLTRSATIRFRGASDSGFSNVVVDTGALDAWPVIYPWGTLPFGHPSFWDGKITEEDKQGYNIPFVHIFDTPVNARYWRCEIADSSNPAGYVELSRLFLCSGWQPTLNMSYGAKLRQEPLTEVSISLGKAEFYRNATTRRRVDFSVENLTVDEALTWPLEIQRKLGIDGQLFFVFDPDDTVHLHRRSFLATVAESSPLDYPYHNRNNVGFSLKEVVA